MKDNSYILPQKADLKQLKVSEIESEKPDLKNIFESKSMAISKWLMSFIENGLKDGSLSVNELLPSKPELAYFLGVSIGTIQNSLRYIEDLGYVESKQCIGTMIRDYREKGKKLRKLTSKRELTIETIKKYIIENHYKKGQMLPSSRILSSNVGCSANTTRLALEYLGSIGVIEHNNKSNNEGGWIVKSIDTISADTNSVSHETLVNKIEKDLKDYISQNLKIGEKMPAHAELSEKLKASIKTVHDGLKMLISEGILLARRGRYGTTVIKMPYAKSVNVKKETSIFASAKDTEFYFYEKTQNHIKKMIAEKYQIGEKLPSILELSKDLDLSPNTIRKAFHNLSKEGYLAFSRGRYGGTFVIDIPEADEGAFKWLAVNPKYAEVYKSTK
ncbi:MAG: GntR family transcriptional regulator [Clostridiaceae bacterium]|jgi:DNA-binding GntR family transcriptional regulator|nr:GntR family transcriptional regulator [Clostridiaceae bacterium]